MGRSTQDPAVRGSQVIARAAGIRRAPRRLPGGLTQAESTDRAGLALPGNLPQLASEIVDLSILDRGRTAPVPDTARATPGNLTWPAAPG
jgi:hypothetical protein